MNINLSLFLIAGVALSPAAAGDVITLIATVDNCIYEEDELLSNGEGDHFFSGNTNNGDTRRGLVQFNVADSVPSGSTIQSVSLALHCSMTQAGSQQVSLHRLTSDFGEGASHAIMGEGGGGLRADGDATWVHTFWSSTTPELWATPGGDFIATASDTISVGGQGSYQWTGGTLAADVQSMLDDPANDFGWIVRHVNESGGQTAKRFDSRSNASASWRPMLEVIYTPPAIGTNFCTSSPNSVGTNGSAISASGSASQSANNLVLHADGLPAAEPGIFYYGPLALAGAPFGDGIRCVGGSGGSVVRCLPIVMSDSAGEMTAAIDNTLSIHGQLVAGATLHFQCWYRDPAAGGASFNLSNGLSLLIGI